MGISELSVAGTKEGYNCTNGKFKIGVNKELFSTNEGSPSEGNEEIHTNELYTSQGINLTEVYVSSQEGYLKGESFNEDSFKEESSQEESSNDDTIQEVSFEEELFREISIKEEGSSTQSSTIFHSSRSSSLYSAEFVQTSCECINPNNNVILSPLQTSNLRFISNDTNNSSMSERSSLYLPKPTTPEDYKWRKCCRNATIWGIVALIIIVIFAIIVDQWFKLKLL
ncbi:10247_t:CDS:2 [Funneliformis geosporum]|uniref:10247_t:CDS:1 n=1 Tax=Funneliformis geosporum TaxID=1117311 RepID=A0A9W4SHV3_9GLOM|nr:10247_t:CDS:2 [Funneliformis geosporum]